MEFSKRAQRVLDLRDSVDEVQERYAEYGAADSEPRYVADDCLLDALRGEVKVPTTGSEWQLFTFSMKCGRAARSLAAAARKMAKAAVKLSHKDAKAIAEYYGWHL